MVVVMFRVTSNNSVRTYSDARGVAKDFYFREKRAGKTSLNIGEGIKWYMGFIGENIHNSENAFDIIVGGKTVKVEYVAEMA